MAVSRFGTEYDRLFACVCTPFKEDGQVDEPALRHLLQYFMQPKFIDAGGAIIINPEAGEVFYLDRKEKRRNVEIAVEECGSKMPVFAGVCGLTTKESVQVAEDIKAVGADGLFLLPPMGAMDVSLNWDPERFPEVWTDMAKAQVEAVDLPAIVHPSARLVNLGFGMGLPVNATLHMCNAIPNIVGWKMTYSYNSALRIARMLRTLDHHVGIFIAGASMFHEYLASGYFEGTVSGFFNYAMEPMIDHINAWRRKDLDEAMRIWKNGLEDIHYWVTDSSRLHVRYKTAAWLRGLIPLPFGRPPFPEPRKEEVEKLKQLLKATGIEVIPDKDIARITSRLSL